MQIKFVEIQNFRKLKSVRIDFNEDRTIFVGANNSGKTSAMDALGHFLVGPNRFSTNDFTLSNWETINQIGTKWVDGPSDPATKPLESWRKLLPTLDLWLDVRDDEIHYVRHFLPSLSWTGGLLGIRLLYCPENIEDLKKEYLIAVQAAQNTKGAVAPKNENEKTYNLSLWPQNLRDFLERKLKSTFNLQVHLLDPAKLISPKNGVAEIQELHLNSDPIGEDSLKHLIRIDEIGAQRGLGGQSSNYSDFDGKESTSSREKRKLSEQLRAYYSKHLDPIDYPVPADLDALEAIENAQKVFDERLSVSFLPSLTELASLNYPGVTDPRMKIATKIRPTDGLNHSAAIQYEVSMGTGGTANTALTLPEEYNGLGYQNLISMVFRLMSFRDAWMRVGKAGKSSADKEYSLPPLHLVLVEEPEAHLHAQVQQVFVRKAYDVLRNHPNLKSNKQLQTQLIVSTHSSHVAHECEFACLRYFRRLPSTPDSFVPTSVVINLSEVFGANDDTEKFVARYLKAMHCDLFFADAAIFIEGSAERILVPHFIKKHFSDLNRCYITLLEIGGSHSHRLRNLVENLGIVTLIITDIDCMESAGGKAIPKRKAAQVTDNDTLKTWHPEKTNIDELLDLSASAKEKKYPSMPLFSIRVSYQIPISINYPDPKESTEVLATTFEDSLVLENLSLFKSLEGTGMVSKIRNLIQGNPDVATLTGELFKIVRDGKKAAFALDLLWLEKSPNILEKIIPPRYISEGLGWLQEKLRRVEVSTDLIAKSTPKVEAADVAN